MKTIFYTYKKNIYTTVLSLTLLLLVQTVFAQKNNTPTQQAPKKNVTTPPKNTPTKSTQNGNTTSGKGNKNANNGNPNSKSASEKLDETNMGVAKIDSRKYAKSGLGRAYQDLTAYYNRHFNAQIRYLEGTQKLAAAQKEDYRSTLSPQAFSAKDATAINEDLEAIIKKTSMNIQLKPSSKWVDNSYLMLGKAYYLKGDNESAVESFQYVLSNFDKNERLLLDKKSIAQQKEKDKKEREEAKKDRAAEAKKTKETKRKQTEKLKEQKQDAKEERLKEAQKAKEEQRKEAEKLKKQQQKEKDERKKQLQKEKEKERKAKEKAKKQGKKYTPPPKKTTAPTPTKPPAPTVNKPAAATTDTTKAELPKTAPKPAVKTPEPPKTETAQTPKKQNDGGIFKHQLSKYEATIWLARTYTELNKLNEAEATLNKALQSKRFPKKLNKDLYATAAQLYIAQKNLEKANEALQIAAKNTPRRNRARLYYVTAQLNEQQKQYDQAVNNYQKVLKSKAPYEMELNAQVNIAKNKLQAGSYSNEQATAALQKLADDPKNKEYKDQIMNSLSDVALQSGDIDKATQFLTQATKANKDNTTLKGTTFLKLAELHYLQDRYLIASTYYDSTVLFLPKNHEKYKEASQRKTTLAELSKHISTIQLQDSLQNIANMPTPQRNEFIDKIIKQFEKEAQLKKAEQEKAQQQAFLNDNNNPNNPNTGGQWYFSNQAVKGLGYNNFKQQYGNRPLTDYWRISSRQQTEATITTEPTATNPTKNKTAELINLASEGKLNKDAILQQLPTTPEAKAQSDTLIAEALYFSAKIYKDQLNKKDNAQTAFAKLTQRYPQSKYAAPAYYQLFLLAKQAKNDKQTEAYKKTILENYPQTIYAQLVENPDNATTQQNAAEQYYAQTYQLYKQKQYNEVIQRTQNADQNFKPNTFKPQYDLLTAFTIGATQNQAAYLNALQIIVKTHSNTEVAKKAQEIIDYIQTNNTETATTNPENPNKNTPATNSRYTYNEVQQHYLVVALGAFTTQMSTITNRFSDYNTGNYSSEKLKTSQMLLDAEKQILIIKDFANAGKAMKYLTGIKDQEMKLFAGLDVSYKYFVISKNNFSEYFKQKDTDAYYQFFIENYK